MCDFWQDEEGIIQSEEETAEEMSSYKSEDNQGQVGNKVSTLKKINDCSKAFSSSTSLVEWIFI